MKQLVALTLILLCAPLGCSNAEEPKKSERDDRGFSLMGVNDTRWARECLIDEAQDRSQRSFIRLYKRTSVHTFNYYDGIKCQERNIRVSYVHTYGDVMREVNQELKGWETFYFNLITYVATVKNVGLLKDFNFEKRYEYSDWQLNIGKDITDRRWDSSSQKELKKGEPRSSTMRLVEDKLYFSDYKNGRPVARDDYFYTKIK